MLKETKWQSIITNNKDQGQKVECEDTTMHSHVIMFLYSVEVSLPLQIVCLVRMV